MPWQMHEADNDMQALLTKVAGWLKPHGKLFVHHFCHKRFFYNFEVGAWSRISSAGELPACYVTYDHKIEARFWP